MNIGDTQLGHHWLKLPISELSWVVQFNCSHQSWTKLTVEAGPNRSENNKSLTDHSVNNIAV